MHRRRADEFVEKITVYRLFPFLYLLLHALITSVVPLLIAQFAAKLIQEDNLAEQLSTTK
jgi:hypothetical protein